MHDSSRFPGAALRALRRTRSMTLASVSEKTGLPIATLSRIENNQVSPTFEQLSKLSRGLDIDIAELLSPRSARPLPVRSGRRSLNRRGDGSVLDTPMQTLRYLSSDLTNKHFSPIIAEVKSRSLGQAGEFHQHEGEEFVYVIAGVLELHSEGYSPLRLEAGESVYFDSTMPHAYVAVGDQACRLLSVCTSPHELAQAASRRARPNADVAI